MSKNEHLGNSGPDRQSYRPKRKHPYIGITTRRSRPSNLLNTLKQRGNLSQIKTMLNDHYRGQKTDLSQQLSDPQALPGTTSTEDEELNTTTSSDEHTEPNSTNHSEYEHLANLFNT
jgi:hypothetical protein